PREPRASPLFPYTTLFRSFATHFGAVAKPEGRGTAEEIIAAPEVVCASNKNVIVGGRLLETSDKRRAKAIDAVVSGDKIEAAVRSEEHTSELQSLRHLVCR